MQSKFKSLLINLIKSILAGFTFVVGGGLFLLFKSFNNYPLFVVGSFLFSATLIIILCCKLNLFTGKIGVALEKKYSFLDYVVMYFGNFIGCFVVGGICLLLTKTLFPNNQIYETVVAVSNAKTASIELPSLLNCFITSLGCGATVYLAVESFNYKKLPFVVRILLVILFIGLFVVNGWNHCIANMFYFVFAWNWSINALIMTLVCTLGNGLIAILLNTTKNLLFKK